MALTVAWVPTGMKTGVSTVACGRVNTPHRAALSGSCERAVTVKAKGGPLRVGATSPGIGRADRIAEDDVLPVDVGRGGVEALRKVVAGGVPVEQDLRASVGVGGGIGDVGFAAGRSLRD